MISLKSFARATAIGALGLVGVTVAGQAGAAAAEYECVWSPVSDRGSSIYTFGGYDMWVLEAGGQEFRFDHPGDGVRLETGNGAKIEGVRKCHMSAAPAPAPKAEPAVAVLDEEAIEPEETAPSAPTTVEEPERQMEDRTEPKPDAAREPKPEKNDRTTTVIAPDPVPAQENAPKTETKEAPVDDKPTQVQPAQEDDDAEVRGLVWTSEPAADELANTGAEHLVLTAAASALIVLGLALRKTSSHLAVATN